MSNQLKKILIIGAGSQQFGLEITGNIINSKKLVNFEICLYDINPKALDITFNKCRSYIQENNLKNKISATTNKEEAFKNCNYVVIMIEVGDRFKLWDMDWSLARQYGLKQVYAENGGAGGLFHSLRIIPPILEICSNIEKYCPDAWVFNYSNPMSRICTTVVRKFPKLKFVGLCHEIASLKRYLPSILNTELNNINYIAGGLNHFSCMLEVSFKDTGIDAYNLVLKNAPSFFENLIGYSDILEQAERTGSIDDTEGATKNINIDTKHSSRKWSDRYLFKEFLTNFDLLPITVDSHFGEYLSWAWQVSDHTGILDFYHLYSKYLCKQEATISTEIKERLVAIICGLEGFGDYIEDAVNIKNDELISELADFMVVEVPAKVSLNKLTGVGLDISSISAPFANLLRSQVGVHDMIARAVLEKSKKAVLQAFLVDPVCDRIKGLNELIDIIINRQKPYLDYLE